MDDPGNAGGGATASVQTGAPGRRLSAWACLLGALVVVATFMGRSLHAELARAEVAETTRLGLLADLLVSRIDSDLAATDRALRGVIADHLQAPASSSSAQLSRRMHALVDAMPGVRAMMMLDAAGTALAASDPALVGTSFAARDYFAHALAHPDFQAMRLSAPFVSLRGDRTVVAMRALAGPDGQVAAVLIASLDPQQLGAMFKPLLYAPEVRVSLYQGQSAWLHFPTPPAGADGPLLRQRRSLPSAAGAPAHPLALELSRPAAAVAKPILRDELRFFGVFAALAAGVCVGLHLMQRRRALTARREDAIARERGVADALLERVMRNAETGLWQWEIGSDTLSVDRNAVAILGDASIAGITAAGWRARIDERDAPARAQALQRCSAAGGADYDLRYRFAGPAGSWLWLRERGHVSARDAAGNAVSLAGTYMNISAAMAAAREVLRGQGELEAIFENLSEAVFLFDAQCHIVRANRPGRMLHGLFDQDLAPGALDDAFEADLELSLPGGGALAPAAWPSARATGGDFVRDLELQVRRISSGKTIVAEFTTAPLTLAPGGAQWVMTCRDVTEQRLARALRNSEARFRTLIEDAPLAIAVLRRGTILYTNPRYRDLHGRAPGDDLCGLPWRAMLHATSLAALGAEDASIMIDSPNEQRFEAVVLNKQGDPVPVFKTTVRVQLSDGAATLMFVQDISVQKRAEAGMLLARNAAESASRGKAEFLTNMSHEIRSPLNAILGLAYLLEQTRLPAEALDMVRRVRSSGRSLLGIINDILDVSKIEAGHMQIERVHFHLDDVMARLADSMGIAVADKRIDLLIHPLPARVDLLLGDAMRLEQVLVNLTGNAIKFTEHGMVEVRCTLREGAGGAARLAFSVRDTGIGIAPERQAEMFSAFTQADSSTTRRFGGTGLGLTICRQLVGLMGGEIWVDSAVGKGSTVHFTLPYEHAQAPVAAPAPQPELAILIAADSLSNLEILAAVARQQGWHAALAGSGEGALARVLDAAPGQRPDAVLLDWKLAGQDGLITARMIRDAVGAAECPLVIMSSTYGLAELASHPDADLIDAVLTKPVTAAALRGAVNEARRRRAGAAGVPAAADGEAGTGLRGVHVLVVDDSDVNREVAAMILRNHGAEVSLAGDGAAALAWLDEHPELADVVLMDVQMPGMDGLEATRRLRRQPRFDALPVIALTAGAFTAQRDAALAAGMDYFVGKPFDVAALIDLIARVQRRAPGAGSPAAVDAHEGAVSAAAVELDIAQGMAIWADLDLYRGYLAWFVTEYGGAADAIGAHLACDERDGARSLAHKVAGVAGNLGLNSTMLAAAAVERALAPGGDAGAAHEHFGVALRRALSAIEHFNADEKA